MTTATPKLDAGTQLAIDRTRLAYERTMMAWLRTSASMISFGFTIHKFFQFRGEQGAVPDSRGDVFAVVNAFYARQNALCNGFDEATIGGEG